MRFLMVFTSMVNIDRPFVEYFRDMSVNWLSCSECSHDFKLIASALAHNMHNCNLIVRLKT